ncbi:hypothetical protein HEP87_18425 [Streptomyces sp. S1D4-11]|nr:hypothetical protein [Streptomyces sp. S1D4-11]QIY95649.1 hypothetical protein HEP87_18425 [Streptomyces sp. S1D4-11]
MKLAVGVLCDHATVREGLLHMLGGGVTTVALPFFPNSPGLDLALLIVADDFQELRGAHKVGVKLMSSASQEILGNAEISWVGPEFEIPDDRPIPSIPASVPLRSILLREQGKHEVIVEIDGTEAARLAFFATGQTPPQSQVQPASGGQGQQH